MPRVLICSMNKNTYAHECEEYVMPDTPDTTSPDEFAELDGDNLYICAQNDKAMPGTVFLTVSDHEETDQRVDMGSAFTTGEIRKFRDELDKVIARAEKQETTDGFVPDFESMTVKQLLQSCLNAGSIDALANTPDYELVKRIEGAPALVELERRAAQRAPKEDQ